MNQKGQKNGTTDDVQNSILGKGRDERIQQAIPDGNNAAVSCQKTD